MAHSVNSVWNFCNETQKFALKHPRKWPSAFDLDKLTSGSSKELGINSTTIQCISAEYVTRRKQFKKNSLSWRSNKKSLVWIPFKAGGISFDREAGIATYSKLKLKLFYSRPLEGRICSGSITADARGRFYLNVVCEIPDFIGPTNLSNDVGIDLGLKDLLTTSDSQSVGAKRYYRKMEKQLAKAQQAKKKKLIRKIHAKIANQRKDFNHKISKELTDKYSVLYVGDVSSKELIKKPNLAKSVNDASWFQLKTFLSYKALAKGGFVRVVNERYSTQTCSECGCIPKTSPKGVNGLNIREWTCCDCGTHHMRDVNAARNILSSGRRTLQRLSSN